MLHCFLVHGLKILLSFSAGDARNEVMTTHELSKLKYDPAIYRANALQGLVYDPAREYRPMIVVQLCILQLCYFSLRKFYYASPRPLHPVLPPSFPSFLPLTPSHILPLSPLLTPPSLPSR